MLAAVAKAGVTSADIQGPRSNLFKNARISSRGMDMKASRFTEEQIIGILREQEAGAKTSDVCRKPGISSARSRCSTEPSGLKSTQDSTRRWMKEGGSGHPNRQLDHRVPFRSGHSYGILRMRESR